MSLVPRRIPTDPVELLYYGLLLANLLVAVISLIVGPRVWTRRLCAVFLWLNGLLLLAVTTFLTHSAITTPVFRDEASFGFALAILLVIPLALQFLFLLGVALLRLRPRPMPPPPG